jgi:hypothetical protein
VIQQKIDYTKSNLCLAAETYGNSDRIDYEIQAE